MRKFFENAKAYFGDKKITGVEIGVASGDNASNVLLELTTIDKLYLIDSYKPYYGCESEESQNKFREMAITRLSGYKNIEWLFQDSIFASFRMNDMSLDFVYIDANHHVEGIYSDIMAWFSKVRIGGIIGGHDYDSREDDYAVSKVVTYWTTILRPSKLTIENSDWWVIK